MRRSHGRVERSTHASPKPSRFCPSTAEPMTNTSVSQTALPNSASSSAFTKFDSPTNDGETDDGPVSV